MSIMSQPASRAYMSGWLAIFGSPKEELPREEVPKEEMQPEIPKPSMSIEAMLERLKVSKRWSQMTGDPCWTMLQQILNQMILTEQRLQMLEENDRLRR